MRALLAFCFFTFLSVAAAQRPVERDTLTLFDQARQRPIQVAIYHAADRPLPGSAVVLFSHGYNANRPGSYLGYTYLLLRLAGQGFCVVSVQHELPTDDLLAMTGNAREVRRPNWERGVRNLLFVLGELRRLHPELDFAHLTIMGHSNGGDISALFTEQHPDLVDKLVTLDNRRMPLPRTEHPRIFSLRSSDQPPDEGVLPDATEQQRLGMRIIALKDTPHNAMSDQGTAAQHAEVLEKVLELMAH